MSFIPPAVSRRYRHDWQFALDISRRPFLRRAALVISAMPLIIAAFSSLPALLQPAVPSSLWLTWTASVLFTAAWVMTNACPKFVHEYRDFGKYKKRRHSHRWIVWEFSKNLKLLSGWKSIVKETVPKQLVCGCDELPEPERSKVCAVFPKSLDPQTLQVFPPMNINRDIYLPIQHYGERLVLALQEADPKLKAKEKELFWILYAQAVKERPVWRAAFWILTYLSGGLIAFNILFSIWKVVRGWGS